ncbi:MAG: septum formation protein Maf [Candidatus Omnitrophica bacterium]|nr:septum formation protein Maf [Candidatus Omnitrophota bacterium]
MRRKIILASASKRRSAILTSCGIKHKTVKSRARELHSHSSPVSDIVKKNAEAKVLKVASKYKNSLLIGADTLVRLGSKTIGKPRSRKEAETMLYKFSGKKIDAYTGIHLLDTKTKKSVSGYEKSSLYVKRMDGAEIKRYFKALRPYDKAGGFSIEGVGSIIFDDIRGSYFNILGLPMQKLAQLFQKINLNILDFI